MDLLGITPIVLPQTSNATPVIMPQSSTLILTQLSFIVGLIVLIFAVANFLKLRKPSLKLAICDDNLKDYIPKITRIYFENLSDSFINDLEISWELYLDEKYRRIACSRIVSGVVFGPRNKVVITIPIKETFQKLYKSFEYSPEGYKFKDWNPGGIYLILYYRYKFYKLMECGSLHYKWNIKYCNWTSNEPDWNKAIKESVWEQLLEKTKVKHWWQLYIRCPSSSLRNLNPDECAELKQTLKMELIDKAAMKKKEMEEIII